MVEHLIVVISRGVLRRDGVSHRHPSAPLPVCGVCAFVAGERLVERGVDAHASDGVGGERIWRCFRFLLVSRAFDVVQHDDGSKREPRAEGGVDGEMASLVEVGDAGDVRHALDGDESAGFGLVGVERSVSDGVGGDRAVHLAGDVGVDGVLGVAHLGVGVVCGAESGPQGAAVTDEDDERVVAAPAAGRDLRGGRGDIIVPTEAKGGDDVQTPRTQGGGNRRGEGLPPTRGRGVNNIDGVVSGERRRRTAAAAATDTAAAVRRPPRWEDVRPSRDDASDLPILAWGDAARRFVDARV